MIIRRVIILSKNRKSKYVFFIFTVSVIISPNVNKTNLLNKLGCHTFSMCPNVLSIYNLI